MTNAKKILIMGQSGAGKTTLARALVVRLNAVHFNADEVRTNIHKDLGFSEEDRIEHARRMGWLCDQVTATGAYAIADFICPTPETRAAFGDAFTVFVDRVDEGPFDDTNQMFVPPASPDVTVTATGEPDFWAEKIAEMVRPIFRPKAPTALFVGRYQPFHDGHKRLIEAGLERVGQVCIAVRDTGGTDSANPFVFEHIKGRIEEAMRAHLGRFSIIPLPNITHVFYGRDVGYVVERIEMPADVEAVSGSDVRSKLQL